MYDTHNIFAKIIRKEIPAKIVFEDDSVFAINDVAPVAPVHILVMPKGEYISFDDFVSKAQGHEVSEFFIKVKEIAGKAGLKDSGYRIVMNHGPHAMQTIPHFHVHILGGRPLMQFAK